MPVLFASRYGLSSSSGREGEIDILGSPSVRLLSAIAPQGVSGRVRGQGDGGFRGGVAHCGCHFKRVSANG